MLVNTTSRSLIPLTVLFFVWITFLQTRLTFASECTHYASPVGSGNGASADRPYRIADFWPRARAGYTLCLLDGEYTGSASMINPPQNLSGTHSSPITIRALNDGKATIDGQSVNRPVFLRNNDYFILEGFNAHHSKSTVVELSRSNYNIVRRVAAWDAADGNTNIFGAHRGTHNLFEDVAGWGIARKIFASSQGGNFTTFRRAWGRWEGSHVVGPKVTYSLAYNNYDMTCENCIGTWSGERMKSSYTLLDYYGKPWTGKGAGTYTDYKVDQPYAIFGVDALKGRDKSARAKLLGSIAYVRETDRFAPPHAIFVTKLDSVKVMDTVVYIEPGAHTSKKPFSLHSLQRGESVNLTAKNLTGIGGKDSTFASDWKKSQVSEGASLGSVSSVFSSSSGARICHRYKDGVLTHEPLWPWPMNRRIMDAMRESGRTPVDVTKTIELMFGPIPPRCKSTNSSITYPDKSRALQ